MPTSDSAAPTPQRSWRTPILIMLCGALVFMLSAGTRQTFGLFLRPLSSELGWGREVFAPSVALLTLLRQRGEVCVCEIAAALKAGQATLSRHLRILRDGRLVRARRDGPNDFYSLDAETLADVTSAVEGLSRSGLRRRESLR